MGCPLDQPIGTVTGIDHHSIVACHLERQFGNSVGEPVDSPMGTVMPGGGGKTALVAAFLSKYYGAGTGQELRGPAQTITSRDRFGLVTVSIEGETYAIADIGMRMLQPRELFRAQGVPRQLCHRPDCERAPASEIGSGADGRELSMPSRCRGHRAGEHS